MSNITWAKPKDFQYLFLDMNAFFASVEQQENPSFRNKPVAVTPVICKNGCIVSPSYEARALGIKTGTRLEEARKICPQIIFRSSNTYTYLKYHRKLNKLISQITPFYTIKSIDELVLKISPLDQSHTKSYQLGKYIKEQIHKELGNYMNCSIGISSNPFLAKTAAEYKKPNGLTILKISQIKDVLKDLKLTDLCGISFAMEKRLNAISIYNPIDFYKKDLHFLENSLGVIGESWFLNLHGYDPKPISKKDIPGIISQSHVLEPKFRSWPLAWSICLKLISKATRRLREQKLITKHIALKVNCYDKRFFNDLKIHPTKDLINLSKYFKILWTNTPKYDFPFKITIILTSIYKDSPSQLNLFHTKCKEINLSETIDSINSKYSKDTVSLATTLKAKDQAPDRITFGQPNF